MRYKLRLKSPRSPFRHVSRAGTGRGLRVLTRPLRPGQIIMPKKVGPDPDQGATGPVVPQGKRKTVKGKKKVGMFAGEAKMKALKQSQQERMRYGNPAGPRSPSAPLCSIRGLSGRGYFHSWP